MYPGVRQRRLREKRYQDLLSYEMEGESYEVFINNNGGI